MNYSSPTYFYIQISIFLQGKGWRDLSCLLNQALSAAERLGDRRSWAMINLHLGRLFYLSINREKALEYLDQGLKEVKRLGDEDIVTHAAEFTGFVLLHPGVAQKSGQLLRIGPAKVLNPATLRI